MGPLCVRRERRIDEARQPRRVVLHPRALRRRTPTQPPPCRGRSLGSATAVVLTLLASACSPFGGVRSGASLCALVSAAEATAALGALSQPAVAEKTVDHPVCEWTATSEDGRPRAMSASLWREAALRRKDAAQSGALFFESELHALEKDFPRTRVLGGLGDAAVIGFGDISDERFTGGIIVRKDGDVLSMRIDGADPAAFEEVARLIAAKM